MESVLACQKAPSAIRCIKTVAIQGACGDFVSRQKAPSAIRCIKTKGCEGAGGDGLAGQKAPSAIRCIKTVGFELMERPRRHASEST